MKPRPAQSKFALACVADDDYLPGVAVMLHSFLRTNPWFDGDLIVFCNETFGEPGRALLRRLFPNILFHAVNPEIVESANRIAGAYEGYRQNDARFFKLAVLGLRGYDKVLVCDSDILFRSSVAELFEMKEPILAAREIAAYLGKARDRRTFEQCDGGEDCLSETFNSGFLLFSSEILTAEHERRLIDLLTPETWNKVSTQSADQYLYNFYFAGQATLVEAKFNYVLRFRDAILSFDGTTVAEAKVLHFNLSERPWKAADVLTGHVDNPEILWACELWNEAYQSVLRSLAEAENVRRRKVCYGAQFRLEERVRAHLFIISPNNSGSTFLKNVMTTSRHTWNLDREGINTLGFKGPVPRDFGLPLLWAAEEQTVAGLTDPDAYEWETTRKAWYFMAQSSSPDAGVFVEKSPPFVLIVDQLKKQFANARFIFLVRNPFAIAEGILRRYETEFPTREAALEQIARHILKCFQRQRENIDRHGEGNIWFTYEQMCADPEGIATRIRGWIPELDDLHLDQRVEVKGMYDEPPRDMNADQIARLKDADLAQLSELFSPHEDLLASFGYQLHVSGRRT